VSSLPEEIPWHSLSVPDILLRLESSASGLPSNDARIRLVRDGKNALPRPKKKGPLDLARRQLGSTLPLVLLGSGVLALAFGRYIDGSVVVAVVVLNAFIGAMQEYRAGRAIDALNDLVPEYVTVLRDGFPASVQAGELVVGDVVLVEGGSRVPADLRLMAARNLTVAEAALTGESVPTNKQVDPVARDAALGDRASMLFSGTMIVGGTAKAVVVSTGIRTELGRIASMLRDAEEIQTPLTQALRRFGNVLTIAIGSVGTVVLAVALRRGFPVVDAVRAAVSLVVAAVPASLPAIITVALAVAVARMAKRNAIVRTLPSVETLGSTNVICSDKTGTLTRGEMLARELWTPGGLYELTGAGYVPKGDLLKDGVQVLPPLPPDVSELLLAMALCNDAAVRPEGPAWVGVGDPTEIALVVAAGKLGVDALGARSTYKRLDTIPFDAALRYMVTLHELPDGGQLLLMKGAPEVVFDNCDRMAGGGPLEREQMSATVKMFAARGMRVLGMASHRPDASMSHVEQPLRERLHLLGLVASIDPPRPEAIAAIATCHHAGITVKMVTGDHPDTAKAIGVEIGIASADDHVIIGQEIARMPPDELSWIARSVNVFSRVEPEHKLRLVQALQSAGAVVAMTGDGVNDAPALKQADVGVAMGMTGTGAAKEAAAVILVDDNFASIAAAVDGGRRCYDNLIKSLMFLVPTNLAQSFVLLVGVLFFPVVGHVPLLPIVPLQILWVNLVAGPTLCIPLAFEAAEPDLMSRPPRLRNEPIFTLQLGLRCILVGSVMAAGALLLFADLYYSTPGAGVLQPPEATLRKAQTLVTTTVVLFQVLYLLQCRSLRTSVFKMNPFSNPLVYAGVAVTLVFQVIFVHAPIMNLIFHSAPLGLRDWVASAAVAATVLPVIALEKALYEKRLQPKASPIERPANVRIHW
jgi:magnesium-transporting ATPase (P-type)